MTGLGDNLPIPPRATKKAHWLCWKCGDSVKHRGLRQVVCFCDVAFGEPSRGSIVTYCVF